jgi:hypothetical protein
MESRSKPGLRRCCVPSRGIVFTATEALVDLRERFASLSPRERKGAPQPSDAKDEGPFASRTQPNGGKAATGTRGAATLLSRSRTGSSGSTGIRSALLRV